MMVLCVKMFHLFVIFFQLHRIITGRVRFCDDVEVLVGHDTTICMTGIKIPQNALCHINFENDLLTIIQHLQCAWSGTDDDPLSSLAVCISSPNSAEDPLSVDRCRITDQWQNPIPPEMRHDAEQTRA